MIAPYEHVAGLSDLDQETLLELMNLSQRSLRTLERALAPEGFNLGINLGRAAGAGLEDHLHLHIVPRWHGDTNFMPVLSGTRTLPEALRATFERLRQALGEG